MAVMSAAKLETDQDLKIHAITMIRNDADIILPFLNQAMALFDKLAMVDAQSTDGTLETVKSFAEFWTNISIYSIDTEEKYQAAMMTMLAAKAFNDGVDWVFFLDGDEFINVNSKEEFHNYLRAFRYDVMHMPWINMVPARYGRFNSFDISQEFYWSGRVSPYNKIAVASSYAATNPNFYIHEGNHWVSRDINESPDYLNLNLGLTLLHLPVRSSERLKYRASNALRLLRSKHNTIKGEGYHVERILKLIDRGLPTSGEMNVIASNYSVNDDETGSSLDPKELDWPSKRLPDYIVKPRPCATFSSDLRNTLLNDSKLVWRRPNFVTGSNVKAEIEGTKIRILPQPMAGEGGRIRGRYETLSADNPPIRAALTIDLLIESVAVSFLKIRTVTLSGLSELIPALFCMFAVLRPRRFVELGVEDGMSFFAGCQVAEFLGLDTQCVAIDNWVGYPHASSHLSEVFEKFRATLKELYPSQHYIQAYFEHASECFDEESIDLLYIHGYESYRAVRNDFETWLPKLSQIGVIILDNINDHGRGCEVWRFWEELKERYPSFGLLHCHGLGILYAGVQSNSIRDLFTLLKNQAYARLAQEYLSCLGTLAVGSLELHDDRKSIGPGTVPGLANETVALSRRLLSTVSAVLRTQTIAQQKKTYKIVKDSGLFDVDYYLSTYEDVRMSGVDPIAHFVYYGAAELRNPNARFNTAGYLLKNEDVMRACVNPFEHYIVAGKKENRAW